MIMVLSKGAYHISDSILLESRDEGIKLSDFVSSEDGVQEIILDDMDGRSQCAGARHRPHLIIQAKAYQPYSL